MKSRLADALARGDTEAIINLTSRISAAQAAQSDQSNQMLPYA